MVRPIYAHEMCDPDFSWLITTFQENNPEYMAVESSCLPVVLINFTCSEKKEEKDKFEKEGFEDLSQSIPFDEAQKEPQKRT